MSPETKNSCIDQDLPSLERIAAVALESLDDGGHGFAVFDCHGHFRYGNDTFAVGFAIARQAPQSWPDMLSAHSISDNSPVSAIDGANELAGKGNGRQRHRRVRHFSARLESGRFLWITETRRGDGWLTVLTTDITTLKANERALRCARDAALQAANTDALTGAFNRRFVLDKLGQAVAGLNGADHPICVCLLDLDHFKAINDTYGHAAGDQVIRHFTREMQRHLRPTDVFGRIGGEEFLLLLPDTSIEDANRIVTRLRRLLNLGAPALTVPGFRYTFSAGVTAAYRRESWQEVLQRADRALYEAKRGGRDCHVALRRDIG